jgi:hypothetical protein
MIGIRSWTPVSLPGGYGAENGWFDCEGVSSYFNPSCYDIFSEDDTAASPEKPAEVAPSPSYDPYAKERPKTRAPGTSKPFPFATVVPVGLGVVLLAGAVLFATSKKKKR